MIDLRTRPLNKKIKAWPEIKRYMETHKESIERDAQTLSEMGYSPGLYYFPKNYRCSREKGYLQRYVDGHDWEEDNENMAFFSEEILALKRGMVVVGWTNICADRASIFIRNGKIAYETFANPIYIQNLDDE